MEHIIVDLPDGRELHVLPMDDMNNVIEMIREAFSRLADMTPDEAQYTDQHGVIHLGARPEMRSGSPDSSWRSWTSVTQP